MPYAAAFRIRSADDRLCFFLPPFAVPSSGALRPF